MATAKKTSRKKTPRASRPKAPPPPAAPADEAPKVTVSEEPQDAGPKTEFSGRYRVLSQIRFMCPLSKKARNQLPYVMLPGDPKKGIKARQAAAYLHCPSEISKQQVNDFFAKGCVAAAFE